MGESCVEGFFERRRGVFVMMKAINPLMNNVRARSLLVRSTVLLPVVRAVALLIVFASPEKRAAWEHRKERAEILQIAQTASNREFSESEREAFWLRLKGGQIREFDFSKEEKEAILQVLNSNAHQ